MEIETVRNLVASIATQHPKPDDSQELQAIRALAVALLHIAEGVEELRLHVARDRVEG